MNTTERTQAAGQPRLLFVVNACWFFVSHRLPVALAAQRAGFEVHVAAAPDETTALLAQHGIGFHPLPLSRRSRLPLRELAAFGSLLALYRRLRPQVVHHVTIKPVLYGGLAARLAGVPAVVHAISGLGYTFLAPGRVAGLVRAGVRGLYRLALGHPNQRVIFQNDDDRTEFVSRRLVRARDAVLIRGSGVDPAEFTPAAPPEGDPLVVLPSRLLWDKGVGEFVEAARMLRARGVRARFALVGDADPHNPATVPAAQLERWRREGAVEIWGRRTDMPQVLQGAHVVCLPSYREGLSRALIEAASAGLPIVTTDVPGCRDVVRHGYNGLLVPAANPGRLAQALQALIDDPSLRARMGARGRERVLAEFSLEQVMRESLEVYRAVHPVPAPRPAGERRGETAPRRLGSATSR